MRVRPDELANLCAVFQEHKTGRFDLAQMERVLSRTLLIDSECSPQDILGYASSLLLVSVDGSEVVLLDLGRKVAKKQRGVRPSIGRGAAVEMMKDVYLNPEVGEEGRLAILEEFRPDPAAGTFSYLARGDLDRGSIDLFYSLVRVGLLRVESNVYYVRSEFLGLFNGFLATARGIAPASAGADGSMRTEIGEVAESLTVEYERARLHDAGYPALASLVQKISNIDQNAGYDVLSCWGSRREPGREIHIEVKGTRGSEIRFYWSRNEREVAERDRSRYWIYVFTNIDLSSGKGDGPVRVNDPIRRVSEPAYELVPQDILVTRR